MATTKPVFSHVFIIGSLFFLGFSLELSLAQEYLKACGFDAIYVFGDSLSDTGNRVLVKFPFGMNLHGAGLRPSDGLLVIDYIAKSAGLPLVDAYNNKSATHKSGVNFATSGVTALKVDFRRRFHIYQGTAPDVSFETQLGSLETYLKGFCIDSQDCPAKLKSSLFFVWIGLNDLNYEFAISTDGTPLQPIDHAKQINLVPTVVEDIVAGINEKLISYGATKVVVPGIPQYGCAAVYLTAQSTNASAVYDQNGCLKDYNDFFAYHNSYLQTALENLGKKHPNVRIVYADTSKAMQRILEQRQKFGFESLTGTCCGIGGKYNFTGTRLCSIDPTVPHCSDPGKYVFFDGLHFTQSANEKLAGFLIEEILPKLQCSG